MTFRTLPPGPRRPGARRREGLGEGQGAPVEDGDLGPVGLDVQAVDAERGEGGEQVLDGLDAAALRLQKGAVPGSRRPRVEDEPGPVRSGPPEDDLPGVRRPEGEVDDLPRVDSDAPEERAPWRWSAYSCSRRPF